MTDCTASHIADQEANTVRANDGRLVVCLCDLEGKTQFHETLGLYEICDKHAAMKLASLQGLGVEVWLGREDGEAVPLMQLSEGE